MGAKPTSTVDIARAADYLDQSLENAACGQAGDLTVDEVRAVRSVIFGLRDQVKEAVTMATDHLTPRLFWRDGERWLAEIVDIGFGTLGQTERRMLDIMPNLETLWREHNADQVEMAMLFGRKFPGRKVRF